MQFSELAAERFSVLEYEHRSVAQESIDQILAAGIAASIALILEKTAGLAVFRAVDKPILREVPWLSLWESCHAQA